MYQHGVTSRGFGLILLALMIKVMISMDSQGHSYIIVKGEILGFMKDKQLQKYLSMMFLLIKNEN